jgi:hypothetical protein
MLKKEKTFFSSSFFFCSSCPEHPNFPTYFKEKERERREEGEREGEVKYPPFVVMPRQPYEPKHG